MKFLDPKWCGIEWSPWVQFEEPDLMKLPALPGVYRVKAIGIDELFYIGQTGYNVRKRLTDLIQNTMGDPMSMPFNDPHTAAPSLWAWRDAEGLSFECSAAPVPRDISTEKREAFECSLLWRYRLEFGASTRCNHGRFHPHYVKSGRQEHGVRGKRLMGTETNPAWGPSYRPLPRSGKPQDNNWMTLDWGPLMPLSQAALTDVPPDVSGICKLFNGQDQLVLVELDLHMRSFLAHLCKRNWGSSEMVFSVITFSPDIPAYQLREIKNDLIGGYYALTRQPPQGQQRFN